MDKSQADIDALDSVLAGYMLRVERGEQVDREELIAAHPAVAEQLRAFFSHADAVETLDFPQSASPRKPPQAVSLPSAQSSTANWQSPNSGARKRVGLGGAQTVPAASKSAECPAQIGRYGVEAILGSGAFGKVYRCYDGVLKRSRRHQGAA